MELSGKISQTTQFQAPNYGFYAKYSIMKGEKLNLRRAISFETCKKTRLV